MSQRLAHENFIQLAQIIPQAIRAKFKEDIILTCRAIGIFFHIFLGTLKMESPTQDKLMTLLIWQTIMDRKNNTGTVKMTQLHT